jgi:hypothetical protein
MLLLILVSVLYVSIFSGSVHGARNVTVDDTNGDMELNAKLTYFPSKDSSPSSRWRSLTKMDPQAAQGTLTEAPNHSTRLANSSIELEFNGIQL